MTFERYELPASVPTILSEIESVASNSPSTEDLSSNQHTDMDQAHSYDESDYLRDRNGNPIVQF